MAGDPLKCAFVALCIALAGCVGGSGDSEGEAPAPQLQPGEVLVEGPDGSTVNATSNTTYLQDGDYFVSHVHDYWNDRTEIVLADRDVNFTAAFGVLYAGFATADSAAPHTGVGVDVFTLGNGSFVPEGTGKLLVSIDATAALKSGTNLVFGYKTTGFSMFDVRDYTDVAAAGPAAELEIPVSPEMSDPPHAKSTKWGFKMEAGDQTVLDGTAHVTITAVRVYDIVAYPAHQDFYKAGHVNRIDVMNETSTFSLQRTGVDRFFGTTAGDQGRVDLPEGAIVPPETTVLVARVRWTLDGSPQNQAVDHAHLDVKPGSSAGFFQPGECFEQKKEPFSTVLVIPVDASAVDSPYAKTSNWAFRTRVEMKPGFPFVSGMAEAASGAVEVALTAFHDPPQWVQDALDEGVECGFGR